MSSVATPYGLKPVQMIGGAPYNGGVIREYKVSANNAAAIFNGDLVVLSSAGQPSAVSSSPVAVKIPATSADATAGIVGAAAARLSTPDASTGTALPTAALRHARASAATSSASTAEGQAK